MMNEGKDNSIRIIKNNDVERFKTLTNTEERLNLSLIAFEATDQNEFQMLKNWAIKNKTTGKERVMSIFTRWVENDEGIGYFPIIMEGSTGVSKYDTQVDPELSKPMVKGQYWNRSTTIHTHPNKTWRDFSNEPPGFLSGGDIQWAIKNDVKLYLVPPSGPFMGLFDPEDYTRFVIRELEGQKAKYGDDYKFKFYIDHPYKHEFIPEGSYGYWLDAHHRDKVIKRDMIQKKLY